MKILCEAVSFGFGPVSKLLSLCEILKLQHSLHFIGSGCSLSLVEKTEIFEQIIECDTTLPANISNAVPFVDYDFVISIMNPVFSKIAIEHGCKLIIIDSLFYMWDKLDPAWKKCDLLIIQSFNGEKERLQNTNDLSNAYLVGPIVSTQMTQRSKCSKNSILINFGGADYPYVNDFSKLSLFIRKLAEELLSLNEFDEKVISIGPRCLSNLQDLREQGFEINTFSHEDFLTHLASTSMLLTIPGLTTAFEAFHLSTPTLFLPPLNYSQFMNLRKFRCLGLTASGSCWDDYFPSVITNQLPEEEGVQLVESFISKALDNTEIIPAIVQSYRDVLQSETDIQPMIDAQMEFYKSLGGCGTSEAVKLIEGVF